MTRRIALTILLSVWATLIAGGVVAYMTTRAALLADLDQTLLARAASLPEIVRTPGMPSSLSGRDEQDRYVMKNDVGQTVSRPSPGEGGSPRDASPRLVTGAFSRLGDGTRIRSVTVKALAHSAEAGASPQPVTIIYSGSAEHFDHLLNRLAAALAVFGLIGGLATAYLAVKVSRAALRPLSTTAEVIGTIDERRLDRRIDAEALPRELAPMAQRLNEMLARLADSFGVRRQFLADASHELRTPVAALVTALEVALRRPRDAQEYHKTLRDCLTDARMLRRLVETLLEQVRSERLDHSEAAQPVNLATILDECATVAEALALPKAVRIVRSYPADLHTTAPANRLRTVAMNLLANAVEHNRPEGTVELACDRQDGRIVLSVRDTGPGIAPEHLPHVFEPFYRADKARGREQGHLGLGLFLVQSHVAAMGGRCDVESQPDKGSCFRVQLPLGAAAELSKASETRAADGVTAARAAQTVQHAA
jgi:heavy metal sensor kinase